MKQKEKNRKKRFLISTIIYLILMILLVLFRFPVTVNRVVAYYQGDFAQAQNVETGMPMTDSKDHPVTDQLTLDYDQGKGFEYEQKDKVIKNEILGTIEIPGELDFQIYQDGDRSLPANLNTLNAKMDTFRLTVREGECVLKALSFQNGDQVQFVLSGEQLLKHAEASGDLTAELKEDGVFLSSKTEGHLDLSTKFGSVYQKSFHRFSVMNLILMVIFTAAYLLVSQGHKIMEKFEQGLIQ